MDTITNDFANLEMWNLNPGDSDDRGPFLVVQRGLAPNDEFMRKDLFVLRRDGQWASIAHYLCLNKPEQMDEAVFETSHEVMELLEQMGPKPEMADAPVDAAALKAWHDRVAGADLMQGIHHWVEGYKARHRFE